jgi:arylsulfatase A-like enzyme
MMRHRSTTGANALALPRPSAALRGTAPVRWWCVLLLLTTLKAAAPALATSPNQENRSREAAPEDAATAASRKDRPPNVLLIVTDDQGWGDLSNMGHPYLRTPRMDGLKAEGVDFPNFLVGPVCAPTRAGLLTGRYHYRTGVHDTYQGRVNMWTDEKTIAEYFRAAGYATGLFGKWHLGYNYPSRPIDQGFDTHVGWEEMQHSRQRPLIEKNGEFAYRSEFLSDVFCREAMAFIRANRDRPFLCVYPLFLPHCHPDNLEIPQSYVERFKQFGNLDDRIRAIYGMIEKADELIGQVLDELDRLGLRDETIVVFLSDNGPEPIVFRDGTTNPNAGLRGAKNSLYEGGLRVPFYVSWPGHLPAGASIPVMANYTDVLPTLLDLAKITPASWEKPVDGRSLAPLLREQGKAEWSPRHFFMHFLRPGREAILADKWTGSCVRGERYKLVNGKELYDLAQDPGETTDVAPSNAAVVGELRGLYEKWFAEVTAERDLQAAPIVVGSDRQAEVRLYPLEKNTAEEPEGWPVDVVSPGPYMICAENLQHTMFGKDVEAVLRCGDLEVRRKIDASQADLVFEGVRLPPGRQTLQLEFRGDVREQTGRYGTKDPGHRLLWVRKEPAPATSRSQKTD